MGSCSSSSDEVGGDQDHVDGLDADEGHDQTAEAVDAQVAAQQRGGLRKPIKPVEIGLPGKGAAPEKKRRRGRKGGEGPNLGL